MCRAWPGFHCSNHPSDKVRKIARQLHHFEKEKEATAELQRAYREENPDTWEGSEEDAAFTTQLEEFQSKIEEFETKRDAEMTEFYATPAGKKTLQEIIADARRKDTERYDSAAELAAADSRRLRQKKIAKALQDPTAPVPVKIMMAQHELKRAKRELQMFNIRSEIVKGRLSDIQDQIWAAKAAGDTEEVNSLNEERNGLMKELAFVEKQRKQLHAHIESTRAWMKRFTSNIVDKAFNWNDQLIAAGLKYLL